MTHKPIWPIPVDKLFSFTKFMSKVPCGILVMSINISVLSEVGLGIGQENHNKLSEELSRLIIDCKIRFVLAMSNNIKQARKDYQIT